MMLTAIIGGSSIVFGVFLLLIKTRTSDMKKDIRVSFAFALSALLFLGSLVYLAEDLRTINLTVSDKPLFSTSIYSAYSIISVTFIFMIFTIRSSPSEIVAKKKLGLSFFLIGFLIFLLSLHSIMFIGIFLVIITVLILTIDFGNDKIHNKNSLKHFIIRLIGGSLILVAGIVQSFAISTNIRAYLLFIGLLVLLPIFPFSVFFADYFSHQKRFSGISQLLFCFVTLYLLISNFPYFQDKILSFVVVVKYFALISMFIVILVGIAQRSLVRQFAYLVVFYNSFIVFAFCIYPQSSFILKYFSISIVFILAFYWLTVSILKGGDSKFEIMKFAEVLSFNKIPQLFYFISIIFLIGIPFTPIFYTLVNVSKNMLSAGKTILVVLCLVSFLMLIYMLCSNFIIRTKNKINTSENERIKINIGRNSVFCMISLLILMLVLSILPVFFFQNLRYESQTNVNFSRDSHMQSTESNSSEGINER